MISNCGLKQAGLVLAAVSGGADSLALLHFLRGSGYPLLVASFNHRLRPEADADVAHVQRIAKALGLPFVTDSADVAAHAEAEGLSIEEAARDLRYHFLFREARKAGAQAVATGHTADDQAETVLMHFLRGAGLAGLKGMPPRVILPVFDAEIPLVRPLLAWTRAQTEAYCHKHSLDYLNDSTNADTTYFRNRLRHELLPQLKAYNPQIRQTLTRSALALQSDFELLNELVDSAWAKVVTASESGFVAFDLPQLRELSPALRRSLFRRAALTLRPGLRDIDFDALERAASLKALDLAGGLKTIIERNVLYVTGDETDLPINQLQISNQYSVFSHQALPAPVPPAQVSGGAAEVEGRLSSYEIALENGWVLTCETLNNENRLRNTEDWSQNTDNWSAMLDADLTAGRLNLRPFRAGDQFEQLGMPRQTVKLSDLFVNLKIPKRLRKNWPVLCVDDEIAWVVGLRMAQRFRVTEKTRQILKLDLKRLP
ncbi:MAG: tRNA lysidine(34) synthetase TilS [Anaerolineae bacterium]|nr:tRNA lysidine(34) synthetase TilS [Anaerolineae bacterium]